MHFKTITFFAGLVLITAFFIGCGADAKTINSFAEIAQYTQNDLRLPAEFRQIVSAQAKRYSALSDAQALGLTPSDSDTATFIEELRQSNWQLTSILADQVAKTSDDGPPIKRINAWTAILAIFDYARLQKSASFTAADIRPQITAYYESTLTEQDPLAATQLLHVNLNSLFQLLDESYQKETSENVRTIAKPVLNKLATAMAAK